MSVSPISNPSHPYPTPASNPATLPRPTSSPFSRSQIHSAIATQIDPPSCICRCWNRFFEFCGGVVRGIIHSIRGCLNCLSSMLCCCRSSRATAQRRTRPHRPNPRPQTPPRPSTPPPALPQPQAASPTLPSTPDVQNTPPPLPVTLLPPVDPTHESSRFLPQIGLSLNRLHARTEVCKEILREHFSQNPYETNRPHSGFNRSYPADSAATIVKIRYNNLERGLMVEQSFTNWTAYFEGKVSQFLLTLDIQEADQATVEIQTIFVQRLSPTRFAHYAFSSSVTFPDIRSHASPELNQTLGRPCPGWERHPPIIQFSEHVYGAFSNCSNWGSNVFPEGSRHYHSSGTACATQIRQAIRDLQYYR